ncbi:MAG: hypothetical protein ABEJ58_06380 [Halodesulfurarchaeum sp.]
MDLDPQIVKAYVDHFLPRDVVGPVLIVFSLEGVIDGLFSLYVPNKYATLGWGIVFIVSITIIGYWGTVDESAVEELHEEIEEIKEESEANQGGSPE